MVLANYMTERPGEASKEVNKHHKHTLQHTCAQLSEELDWAQNQKPCHAIAKCYKLSLDSLHFTGLHSGSAWIFNLEKEPILTTCRGWGSTLYKRTYHPEASTYNRQPYTNLGVLFFLGTCVCMAVLFQC